jgi:hypothetical protein
MLTTANVITLFLRKHKQQKFLENCHINFYFLETENKGSWVMHRVMNFSEKNRESESWYFIPICLPDRRSFSQHHTPVGKWMTFLVQVILSKLISFPDFQRKFHFLQETTSFITVFMKARHRTLPSKSPVKFVRSIHISLNFNLLHLIILIIFCKEYT